MTTKPKLIVPKHIWDGKAAEKAKSELEKVPEPCGYKIVLFPLKLDNKTSSGIHLTDQTVEESQISTNICKVLKIGSDCYLDKSKFPSGPFCKVDDWVIIAKYAGARIKIDGGELRIVNDDEIMAKVRDPRDILPRNIL